MVAKEQQLEINYLVCLSEDVQAGKMSAETFRCPHCKLLMQLIPSNLSPNSLIWPDNILLLHFQK